MRGDINVIQVGVQRSVVIAELGEPDNYSTPEGGGYDDRYKLDPNAHHWAIKLLTGVFYLAGDFLRFVSLKFSLPLLRSLPKTDW